MKDNIPIQELIDTYLMNKMSDDERMNFVSEMSKDSELQKKVEIQRLIMDGFRQQGIISDIKSEVKKEKKKKIYRIIIFATSSAAIFLLVFLTANTYRENNRIDQLFSQNSEYAIALNNLASLYLSAGEFREAEKRYLSVISLIESNGIFEGPAYYSAVNNLGMLYQKLGNYEKAKFQFNKAIENMDTISLRMEYADILNNMALLVNDEKDYLTAESYYRRALSLFDESEKESLRYLNILNNLAALQRDRGLYDKAEYNLHYIAEKRCKVFGEDSPDCLSSLNGIAGLYFFTGKYDLAEILYKDILKKRKKVLGENHPDYLNTLTSLGRLYDYVGKTKSAEPFFSESYNKQKENLNSVFIFLSESEQNKYWDKMKWFFDTSYPSFLYNLSSSKKEAASLMYDNSLFVKNLLLSRMSYMHDFFSKEGDVYCLNLLNELTAIKQQLNISYRNPMNRQQKIPEFENKANQIEKELMENSSEYEAFKSRSKISWKNISENLKKDEVAIEFINFRNYNYKEEEKKIFYCALVLKHNSEPELIYLFEESRLNSLLADESKINDMYRYRVVELESNSFNPNNGKKLYNLIWAPIEKAVGNAKTIYYSPSGKINLISFAALPDNENKVLLEKYNLRQLTSTKEILTETIKTDEVKKIALYGGIDYGPSPGFRSLPGAKEEVENIDHFLNEKNIGQVSKYTDTLANESNFKRLNGKDYDIILIATHGFYIPQEEISKYEYYGFLDDEKDATINPLWRSGLAFAGANQAWTGNIIPGNEEDGILTSFEIAQMNLLQTKLVVLSACETGLGDINGSEGVYGLQRAFKNAGVQTIIMSLWKVPDEETSKMMQLFYQYWLVDKTDKYEAFRKAQIETREKFPNVISWAGFVMID